MNKILSLTRRCVEDYNMISPGDRIAVGVSGGKDSLMLLMALAKLREFYPVPFTVEAYTRSGSWLEAPPAAPSRWAPMREAIMAVMSVLSAWMVMG